MCLVVFRWRGAVWPQFVGHLTYTGYGTVHAFADPCEAAVQILHCPVQILHCPGYCTDTTLTRFDRLYRYYTVLVTQE